MEKIVDGPSEEQMMLEFLHQGLASNRRPDELTTAMAMEMIGDAKKYRRISGLLERLVVGGVLKKRMILEDGRRLNAYSPVQGTWKDVLALAR